MKPALIPGLVLASGVSAFLVAAFLPISRVYTLREEEARLDLITRSSGAWQTSQGLFTIGALLSAGGLGWAALGVDDASLALRLAPGVLLGLGALAWVRLAVLRALRPHLWATGSLPGWHFVVYTLFTMAGIASAGYLIAAEGPRWLSLTLIIVPAVYLVAYALSRDLPPFLHYVPLAAVAYRLLAGGS